ncbi:MAG: response regulator [Bacteroidota bacterium]
MKTIKKLLIFIVDDNKIFLDTLDYQIKKSFSDNFQIKKYATGEECLKEIHLRPHIIILDYLLDSQKPEAMNGIEVLKRIKEINNKIVVLMLSSQDRIDVAVDTIKYEAFDYIIKNESAFMKVQITLNIIKKELSLIWKLKQLKNSMILFFVVFASALGCFFLLTKVFHIAL